VSISLRSLGRFFPVRGLCVFVVLEMHATALAPHGCSREGFVVIRLLAAPGIRWSPLLIIILIFFSLVIVVLVSLLAGQLMLCQHFVERHEFVR